MNARQETELDVAPGTGGNTGPNCCFGAIAQLGERNTGSVEVGGSIPPGSTKRQETQIALGLLSVPGAADQPRPPWRVVRRTANVHWTFGFDLPRLAPPKIRFHVPFV